MREFFSFVGENCSRKMRLKFIFELYFNRKGYSLLKMFIDFSFFFTQREAANFRIVKIRDICNLDREFIIVGSCGYTARR